MRQQHQDRQESECSPARRTGGWRDVH
jgi:hypothetical protein